MPAFAVRIGRACLLDALSRHDSECSFTNFSCSQHESSRATEPSLFSSYNLGTSPLHLGSDARHLRARNADIAALLRRRRRSRTSVRRRV